MREFFLILIISIVFLCSTNNSIKQNPLSIEKTTILRALAAILIVFGHCTSIDRTNILCNFNVGWYCVALFMFISGWGLTYSYKHKKDYLVGFFKNRLSKILIPFISAHMLYGLIKSFYGIFFSPHQIIQGLLGQCTIVESSWYPVVAIIFYICFWLIFRLQISEYLKPIFLTLSILLITFLEFFILGSHRDWWFISNLAFAIGTLLQFFDSELIHRKKYIAISILGYLIGYSIIPAYHIIFGEYSDPIYVLASNLRSGFLSLGIIILISYFNPHNKVIEKLGEISYEIYLMHGLFIFIFSHYFKEIISIFILTIFCSVISAYFLKQVHNYIFQKIMHP